MDLNAFAEEFADLVAEKVARRLRLDNLRNEWPQVETKALKPELEYKNENEGSPLQDKTEQQPELETDAPDETALKAAMGTPKLANSVADARRSVLSKVNIRTLRNKIAAVEEKDASEYSHLEKDALVNYIVDFESLIGRTVDEEMDRKLVEAGLKVGIPENVEDDNDFADAEPEDDTESGELTRAEAERLSLRELKVLALANEVPEAALEGQDIKAVVDLLYGQQESVEPPEASEATPEAAEDDEVELTEDDINAMSIGELKILAEELIKQGADIKYSRATTRGELIERIFDSLEEVEDE